MQFLSTLELNNLLYFHIHLLMLLAGCKCHRSACWRTWVWFKPTYATHLPALWKHYCSRWCPSYHSIWCVQHKVRHQASLFDNLSHGDQKKVCQWSFGKRGALKSGYNSSTEREKRKCDTDGSHRRPDSTQTSTISRILLFPVLFTNWTRGIG